MENLILTQEPRADFFVTGNEYVRDALNFKFIPRTNFAEPDAIKVGLIGLVPSKSLDEKVLENYFKLCLDNDADAVKLFRDKINKLVKNYKATFIDLFDVKLSDKFFQDESHLKPEAKTAITVLLSARLCLKGIISPGEICDAGNDFLNVLSKYFPTDYKALTHYVFCKLASDDFKRLSEILPKDECEDLMARVFSGTTYDHLARLSGMLPKDEYNELAAQIFKISAEKIRRKDKIKISFVVRGAAEWCGDDLYILFAKDKRFEVSVLLYPQANLNNEIVKKDFLRGVEQFKERGLNVVALNSLTEDIPEQDVLIFLTPYFDNKGIFSLQTMPVKILTTYIPYAFDTAKFNASHHPMVWTAWKIFLSSMIALQLYGKKSKVGVPRGIYSGYPRMDLFFKKDAEFHFDWKMTRPDVKKIIWAPHWSINGGVKYAIFQWNYQFMYEFAKAHPETSWIVKPHPLLYRSAISEKVFPSTEAFEEYLQAWNDLPNAKVCTGAYYQDLFATSDGMIHDCGSFTAEYQYVDKPMIYLTRDTQKHNELGEEILKASYLVDGKDLEGIAALMQKVFVEGADYKAPARKEVFDKYLNYPKANGMLASEFIFKNISKSLKG